MQLTIKPGGDAIGLYSEEIDLESVGKIHIQRASYVEPVGRNWFVFMADGCTEKGPFNKRSEALTWEVSEVQRRIDNGEIT